MCVTQRLIHTTTHLLVGYNRLSDMYRAYAKYRKRNAPGSGDNPQVSIAEIHILVHVPYFFAIRSTVVAIMVYMVLSLQQGLRLVLKPARPGGTVDGTAALHTNQSPASLPPLPPATKPSTSMLAATATAETAEPSVMTAAPASTSAAAAAAAAAAEKEEWVRKQREELNALTRQADGLMAMLQKQLEQAQPKTKEQKEYVNRPRLCGL